MAKENENKRPNSRSSLLKNGCYSAFYTLNGYFVKVKPALAIDKVVFSFVKKGTSGTGFDIYVDVDKFDLLCDYILSKELLSNLKDSSLNAPAWDYTTGEKGNKSLKIFQGNNGIVINGYVKEKNQNGNIPVKYDELRTMAKWHRRISAIYFEQMAQECIKAMKTNERFFEQNADTEPDNIPDTTQKPQERQSAQPQQSQDNRKTSVTQSTNAKNSSPATDAGEPKNFRNPNELFVQIKTSTTVQAFGSHGNYCFKGYTKNSKEWTFIIVPSNIPTIGEKQWNTFLKYAKGNTGFAYNIGYVKCKDKLLVTSIKSMAS